MGFVKTLLYTIVHRLFSQDFSQLLDPTVTVQCLLDCLTAISKSTEKNCDQSVVATCEKNIYCSASLTPLCVSKQNNKCKKCHFEPEVGEPPTGIVVTAPEITVTRSVFCWCSCD